MVESCLLGHLPAGRVVATLAAQSEATIMSILVAVVAVFVADIGESQILAIDRGSHIFDFLMTFHARSSCVTSRQRELGFAVIESRRRCPTVLRVASGAFA